MTKKDKQKDLTIIDKPYNREEDSPNIYDGFMDSFTNAFGSKGAFSADKLGAGLGSAAKGLASAAGAAVGQGIGNLMAGGNKSKAGAAIQNIGAGVGSLVGKVNPLAGAAVSAISGIVGGGVNALIGSNINQEHINEIKDNIAQLDTVKGGASSYEELMSNIQSGPQAIDFNQDFIGTQGAWSTAATDEYNKWQRIVDAKNTYAENTRLNDAATIDSIQDANAQYSYGAAFGGPLNRKHSFGGSLSTNGALWDNGYNYIGNGGTHESNPHEGVQVGMDNQGIPNLVEEGEYILNGDTIQDYVLSDRLTIPEKLKEKYKLGKKKDKITFAEGFKKMTKESEERPNDPISNNMKNYLMEEFASTQEEVREKKNRAKQRREFNKLSPQEQEVLLANAQEQQLAQEQAIQEQSMAQEPMGLEGEQYACGGKLGTLFEGDGNKPQKLKKWKLKGDINKDFRYYKDGKYDQGYLDFVNNLDKDWYDYALSDKSGYDMSNYLAVNNGYAGTIDQVKNWGKDGAYSDWHEALAAAYDAYQQGIDPRTGAKRREPQTINTPLPLTNLPKPAELPFNNTTQPESVDSNGRTIIYGKDGKPQTSPEDKDYPLFDNWMRYAPIAGAALGLTQGLLSKPDYTHAESLESIADSAGDYDRVKATPLGDYLAYRPLDRQYALNQLNAQSGATRNALRNSGLGAGTAASILAADYNAGNNVGNLFRQAEEYNLGQREKVATFNRDTNKFNSQQQLQADMANQQARAQAIGRSSELKAKAVAMKQSIDDQRAASINANFSNLFTSIGNLGTDIINRKTAKWEAEHGLHGNYGTKERAHGGRIQRKRKRGLTC